MPESRGLGDVYKRQVNALQATAMFHLTNCAKVSWPGQSSTVNALQATAMFHLTNCAKVSWPGQLSTVTVLQATTAQRPPGQDSYQLSQALF